MNYRRVRVMNLGTCFWSSFVKKRCCFGFTVKSNWIREILYRSFRLQKELFRDRYRSLNEGFCLSKKTISVKRYASEANKHPLARNFLPLPKLRVLSVLRAKRAYVLWRETLSLKENYQCWAFRERGELTPSDEKISLVK